MKQHVEELIEYAKKHANDPTSTLRTNPMLRYELADRMVETEVARMLSYRVAQHAGARADPELRGVVAEAVLDGAEPAHRAHAPCTSSACTGSSRATKRRPKGRWLGDVPALAAFTIEGGTSEIQRNIIAQRGLGLPRD